MSEISDDESSRDITKRDGENKKNALEPTRSNDDKLDIVRLEQNEHEDDVIGRFVKYLHYCNLEEENAKSSVPSRTGSLSLDHFQRKQQQNWVNIELHARDPLLNYDAALGYFERHLKATRALDFAQKDYGVALESLRYDESKRERVLKVYVNAISLALAQWNTNTNTSNDPALAEINLDFDRVKVESASSDWLDDIERINELGRIEAKLSLLKLNHHPRNVSHRVRDSAVQLTLDGQLLAPPEAEPTAQPSRLRSKREKLVNFFSRSRARSRTREDSLANAAHDHSNEGNLISRRKARMYNLDL